MTATTTTAMEVDEAPKTPSQQSLFWAEMKTNRVLLEKSVQVLEKRFALRALRSLPVFRKQLAELGKDGAPLLLSKVIQTWFAQRAVQDEPLYKLLTKLIVVDSASKTNAMQVDSDQPAPANVTESLPELQVYVCLLVTVYLLDQKKNQEALQLIQATVSQVQTWNRRTMDPLAARVFYYVSLIHEKLGKLSDCRAFLMNALRVATLRRDEDCQAVLLNLLLRNYLHYNLIDQADKLMSKTEYPESAGNNQTARYMYYVGTIKAIQLDYTESHRYIQQAIRKAPTTPSSAGFQQAAHRVGIVVQLLMGEIPDRATFRIPHLQKALQPYLNIVQAVRTGDLAKFQETLLAHTAKFQKDKTYTLILRLRHNVIKTGIRLISISYSKISLRDICAKLHLDSEEDAEYIVAKAIRDGVIDASLDHEKGFMKSNENIDVYSTTEPLHAFNQRTTFCLNLYNESIKAMRFPMELKRHFETDEDLREREREISDMVEAELDDEGEF